ncbi:MAG: hypothetical protein IPJ78_07790 [Gemmatimonadetes bacterium]|nr:hypothetical protein [Gemmatimonadota bacterium]
MQRSSLFLLLGLVAVTGAPAAAQQSDRFRINGYSSFEYEQRTGPAGRGDTRGSFDSDGFDLVFNFAPADRFRVAADIAWEHGAASEDQRGNNAIEYAFAEYAVSDWFRVRAGKMFVHFGIYNEIHTAKPAFLSVKEPSSTVRTDKYGSRVRFYPRHASGIAFTGSGQIAGRALDYVVQISNGDQPVSPVAGGASENNPFDKDDNSQKAISGIVRFSPVDAFRIGVSFYRDRPEEYDALFESLGSQSTLASYGAFVDWQPGNSGVEVEWVQGSLDASSGTGIDRTGLSAMVYQRMGRYTPYLRYEAHDPDTGTPDDEASTSIIGLNTRITQGLFLKTEYDQFKSGVDNRRFRGVNFGEIKVSVSVAF